MTLASKKNLLMNEQECKEVRDNDNSTTEWTGKNNKDDRPPACLYNVDGNTNKYKYNDLQDTIRILLNSYKNIKSTKNYHLFGMDFLGNLKNQTNNLQQQALSGNCILRSR